MNKRIQELWVRSGYHADAYGMFTNMEKFAELIVLECAEIANNKMKDIVDSIICEEKIDSEIFVGNKIKEHFGVEE